MQKHQMNYLNDEGAWFSISMRTIIYWAIRHQLPFYLHFFSNYLVNKWIVELISKRRWSQAWTQYPAACEAHDFRHYVYYLLHPQPHPRPQDLEWTVVRDFRKLFWECKALQQPQPLLWRRAGPAWHPSLRQRLE